MAGPDHPADVALLGQAGRLCVEVGRTAPVTIEQLAGGKNNRVFRLVMPDGPPLVLKSYFRHPEDPRDRLGAEWRFLTYAWGRGVRCAPQPIACDRLAGLAIFDFVAGEKLAPGQIAQVHVEDAAEFVHAVNKDPHDTDALGPGSEACFSIADHLDRVDRRVARLANLDTTAPQVDTAVELVREQLEPCWRIVRSKALEACQAARIIPEAIISPAEIIASPSDFGFHNALWQAGRGLVFLDFEYAGWDDPAKLTGDFFACPEIPTPTAQFDRFVDMLCRSLHLGAITEARMRMLRDVYRVKWACIVMNDFLPLDEARRRFANQDARAERCAAQFRKAGDLIAATGFVQTLPSFV